MDEILKDKIAEDMEDDIDEILSQADEYARDVSTCHSKLDELNHRIKEITIEQNNCKRLRSEIKDKVTRW